MDFGQKKMYIVIYIVYGVSGVGKTTIGKALAEELAIPFYDGDDFHSTSNINKMKAGVPLNDMDREPWLKELGNQINIWLQKGDAVLACSALKQSYRQKLSAMNHDKTLFIYLFAEKEIISARLAKRANHFMNPELLKSQFETLELGPEDLHIDANKPQKSILEDIMRNIEPSSSFGLIGLGVMGQSLARNIAGNNFSVAVYNRQTEKEIDIAQNFAQKYSALQIRGFDDLSLFIKFLPRPRNILLMVNAGEAVDQVISALIPLLDDGDLVMDGGNSHYADTERRQTQLAHKRIQYMGVGISGGEAGALKGPSIMPGGSRLGYHRTSTMLNAIAAKDKNTQPCSAYIGPSGSGHFIKMVHNGIEYAEMQLIAELYHFLRYYYRKNTLEIASIFEQWSGEGLDSYLLDITINILRTNEDGQPILDVILDKANQKGTGGWSTNAALALGKPLDSIAQAVMCRSLSAMKDERVKASTLYTNPGNTTIKADLFELMRAYQAARIINHAMGYDLMKEASDEYHWNLNLAEVSRIWTNGCIIRSDLMEKLANFININNAHLLLQPKIAQELNTTKNDLSRVVSLAVTAGCAMPVFSSSLNYFLGFISAQSPANLIQAQRDYFGAHKVQRTDDLSGEYVHLNWND